MSSKNVSATKPTLSTRLLGMKKFMNTKGVSDKILENISV